MKQKILVIHGPNLNMLGLREPEIYGRVTLAELNDKLNELGKALQVDIEIFQSNHEGFIIDKIQEAIPSIDGILINPGGLGHVSVALRDVLSSVKKSIVEVHISNLYKREEFRQFSYTAGVADAVITGFGVDSYLLGLRGLARLISSKQTT